MHDPIRLLAVRSSAFIENKCLSHANTFVASVYDLITAGGLPESGGGGSVCPCSGGVFLVLVTEEVPVILWS